MHLGASSLTEAAAEFRRRQQGQTEIRTERVEIDTTALSHIQHLIEQLIASHNELTDVVRKQANDIFKLQQECADIRATFAPMTHFHNVDDLVRAKA